MRRGLRIVALAAALVGAGALQALAQDATEREVERYRQMLKEDPWSNPGLLEADRGEALWKEKRGPRNASLEACDLGKGSGKVEGAFAELPRYFATSSIRTLTCSRAATWCASAVSPSRVEVDAALGHRIRNLELLRTRAPVEEDKDDVVAGWASVSEGTEGSPSGTWWPHT